MPEPSNTIDLNCDIGESPGGDGFHRELALFRRVSSLNIACGAHAGDEPTMAFLCQAAVRHGRAIGAHPGYPDRRNFGRVDMALTTEQVREAVGDQLASLAWHARAHGGRVAHVKPHGALYHAAMGREEIAEAIAFAAREVFPDDAPMLVGLAGALALSVWSSMGFAIAAEGFADRRYEADGSLRARTKAGALLESADEAAAQALRLARGEGAVAIDGSVVSIRVDTLCLHSDTPGAVAIAEAVRASLIGAGFEIRPRAR